MHRPHFCRYLAALAALLPVSSLADTLLGTATFGYTGGNQSYTVPANTEYVVIKAWGAGGGMGGIAGGGGGFVAARFPASAGQALTVAVGGAGYCAAGTWPAVSGGGWNGGGHSADVSGGGGGATTVTTPAGTVYAGGGGGSCWTGNSGVGGAGGGNGGQNGTDGGTTASANGGTGGTTSAAGSGGAGIYENGVNASGSHGGNGGTDGAPYESPTGWYVDLAAPGGGGGGGYFAGGGGGTGDRGSGGGGGGGGSSMVTGGGTNVSYSGASGSTPGGTSDPGYPGGGVAAGATSWVGTGGNGYVVILAYQVSSVPAITSTGQQNKGQNQPVSFSITTTGIPAPTSYGATGLPPGLSVNTSTGLIFGNTTTPGTYNSTVSATNSIGTGSGTVTWIVTAAAIATNASVSPSSITNGSSLTLTRAGTANFGVAWTENVIWKPDGSAQVLGNMQPGSQGYTPAAGTGTYWYQFRLVDTYSNYADQWISFTVTTALAPPSTVQATGVGSYSVTLGWSGAVAASGVKRYDIYRDGVKIGELITTATSGTYTDSTTLPGVTYGYTIKTIDNNDNVSGASSATIVTTTGSFEVFTPLP